MSGTDAEGAVMVLDDDPVWEQHSGGSGHSGTEWGAGDALLAEAFYADLSDSAQFVFDLMMDRPGEQVSSDWIAAQLSRQFGDAAGTRTRRSVSAVLSSVSQPHRRSGRRLPFYWWRQSAGATLYGMKPGVAQLFRQARQPAAGDGADPDGGDWSAGEVTAVVGDYLEMLQAEITGQRYVKAHHRRALLTRLNPVRTGGAVEYKHQNISAAMLDLGLPWIRGYKPMSNYQDALADEIQRQLEADPKLQELVIGYERDWLTRNERPDLAGAVRWTSRDDGDGLGYDVLSFALDGRERYIEVKATALGEGTPFYITSAELDFARRHADSYALYRVYDVLGEPRFYMLEGDISETLDLAALTYSARITASSG